jgi:Mce-associated membrane protein
VADTKPPPEDSATSKADATALLEEAEAEAAEAEALAAAARARARAARLRREAQAKAEAAEAETAEADTADESDSETEEEAAEETAEAAEPESGRPGWPRRLLSLSAAAKVAALILICAFSGASGYIVWQDREATERRQRAANFVAGAKQGVINMTSLDFNRAKEDVQRLLDSSTGEFRDDFQRRANDFVSVVERSKVVTQGTINATAVESMDQHSASVLVAATSRVTNAAGAQDEARAWRLRVTVAEEGGQYKMSKLEFVA